MSLLPHMISMSTGRLGVIYVDDSGQMIWMHTDTSRVQWSVKSLASLTGVGSVTSVSAVELADGNVGIIYLYGDRLYRATISPTGATVSGASLIEDLGSVYDWRDFYVTKFADDSYYMVYTREDTGTPQYDIMYRTAATWDSWSADAAISLSGIDQSKEISNPSVFESEDGDVILLFDWVTFTQDVLTIKNIFSAISTDSGVTYGAASARTNYTEFGTNAVDPIIVQKSNGTFWLIFYDNRRVLQMDKDATGFLTSCSGGDMGIKDLHCDYVNRKIIIGFGKSQVGIKGLCGIAVIDMATWAIDKIYYNSSTPTLNQVFTDSHVWNYKMMDGDGKWWAAAVNRNDHGVITVLNHTTDTLVTYVIGNLAFTGYGGPGNEDGPVGYSLPRNTEISIGGPNSWNMPSIHAIELDADQNRLYIGWNNGYLYSQYVWFGYIDLTAPPDGEGQYEIQMLSDDSGIRWPGKNRVQFEWGWNFTRDRDRKYIILYSAGGGTADWSTYEGVTVFFDEKHDCGIVNQYSYSLNNSYPLYGFEYAVVYDGALYGSFHYKSVFPFTDQRGLCKLDYITDTITFYRPGYITTNQHWFYDFAVDETNGYIYMATGQGVARFEISSGSFSIFNSDTLAGFVKPAESDLMAFVSYDPVGDNIIAGAWNDWGTNYHSGIIMFNARGEYNQLQYINADKAADYTWAGQQDLSLYSQELYPTAVIDQANILWTIWNKQDWEAGQNILYWGNDAGDISLVDDLTGAVVIDWQLKRVNKLTFKLANGFLYDPQNLLSAKSVVGQKGRKVTVRIGEVIAGFNYWVNQGVFIVDAINMDYQRGQAPILSLNCAGKTGIWKEQELAVSPLYSGSMPDVVIGNLIDKKTQWVPTTYDIPEFDDEHGIYYQWIDKSLWDIIEEICDHFFYAMFEDADGVFRPRKVDLVQAVDHEYADHELIITYTPDDNFSDYTNQVRVIGESRDYIEITHDEEMITSRAGTVGWYTKKKRKETVYFSEDQSRQCRQPRLDVIQSPDEYGLLLDMISSGEGKVVLHKIDPFERYIEVKIDVPDLSAALVGAIIALIAVCATALWCDWSGSCGYIIFSMGILLAIILYILGAVAHYQYEVHARPLGRVKLTIQAIANDIAFQIKLNGEIVTQEITDPLCETVLECQRVADGNMELVKAQRSRINIKKLAHLQDELLDKIKVYHRLVGRGWNCWLLDSHAHIKKGRE